MKKYIPSNIEPKWQKKWKEDNLYLTNLTDYKNKYYILVELPYTSGDLHMGHWFTFTMGDILARFKKRQGFNVLFPNGFDAFGLPAENAAIKYKIHPRDWTYQNVDRMRAQFETLGASIDWTKTMVACDPKYYKWNQWIFLKMLEKGLAYQGKLLSNWCPKDQTVLANENVENGKCWRCGTEVVQKEIDQWFFKITDYAEKLLWPTDQVEDLFEPEPQSRRPERTCGEHRRTSRRADWPKPLRIGQNDWIGKSEGINITYPVITDSSFPVIARSAKGGPKQSSQAGQSMKVEDSSPDLHRGRNDNTAITCFTTRPDTNFGATFIVLAPEHPLALALANDEHKDQVRAYIAQARKKSELERKENKEKTGVFTGRFAINRLNNEKMPIWVADYALMGYGTGAVVGVPGHDIRDFEFAQKFKLPIRRVVVGKDGDTSAIAKIGQVQEEQGKMINSSFLDGLDIHEATQKIMDYLEEKGWGKRQVQYHLHDWSISRQRYWGTPIPIIYCDKCGTVPVPEKDLPVELPYKVDYAPKGKPPLATAEDWVNTECPKCSGPAKREVETMDTFVDSAWYFFRYLDPENDQEIFDKAVVAKWMPLEIYIGGPEHTLGHALYSRFFTMIFKDLGLISFDEYAKKRIHHGTILGPDGSRMSKSRGNVVNPDAEVKSYGADAIRTYLMFLGPFDIVAAWNPDGVNGVYHFLQRVWGLQEKVTSEASHPERAKQVEGSINIDSGSKPGMTMEDLRMMHRTIKKVTEDIEAIKFNTAISALMEWLNYLSKKEKGISIKEYETFLLLLAPFAPHISEELWQATHCHPEEQSDEGSQALKSKSRDSSLIARNDNGWSIHKQSWPQFDNKYLEEQEVVIAVQVNGKVRDTLLIQKEIISNKEVVEKMALDSQKVQKFIAGKIVKKIVYIPGKIISLVVSPD